MTQGRGGEGRWTSGEVCAGAINALFGRAQGRRELNHGEERQRVFAGQRDFPSALVSSVAWGFGRRRREVYRATKWVLRMRRWQARDGWVWGACRFGPAKAWMSRAAWHGQQKSKPGEYSTARRPDATISSPISSSLSFQGLFSSLGHLGGGAAATSTLRAGGLTFVEGFRFSICP
jgi:hypothetical protein